MAVLLASFKNVTSIVAHWVNFHSPSQALEFFYSFPVLKDLEWTEGSRDFEPESDFQDRVLPQPPAGFTIQHLEVSADTAINLGMHSLISMGNSSEPISLTLSSECGFLDEFEGVNALIHLCGARLNKFTNNIWHFYSGPSSPSFPTWSPLHV
jgi:hypothetical protein